MKVMYRFRRFRDAAVGSHHDGVDAPAPGRVPLLPFSGETIVSTHHRKPLVAFVVLALAAAGLIGVHRADARSGRLLAAAAGAGVRAQGSLSVHLPAAEYAAGLGPGLPSLGSALQRGESVTPPVGVTPVGRASVVRGGRLLASGSVRERMERPDDARADRRQRAQGPERAQGPGRAQDPRRAQGSGRAHRPGGAPVAQRALAAERAEVPGRTDVPGRVRGSRRAEVAERPNDVDPALRGATVGRKKSRPDVGAGQSPRASRAPADRRARARRTLARGSKSPGR